jgi:hypothetical protein
MGAVRRNIAAWQQKALFTPEKPYTRVSYRSVFDVDGERLAIGRLDRPLAAEECLRLKRAWERSILRDVVDFEVSPKQVSFLTRSRRVDAIWQSIESLLAANPSYAKAS